MTVKDALDAANREMNAAGIDNYFYESRELLSSILGKSKEWIMSNIDYEIPELEYKKFLDFKEERINGKPFQYILGKQYFMGIEFLVNNDVLIPRADTEILVYKIIEISKERKNIKILDMCTGSGCIAISLAKLLKNSEVFASDISEKALAVAKMNSKNNGVNVEFFCSDLFLDIPNERFDIIVSNPPYIAENEMKGLAVDVLNEPYLALYGGTDGLDFYRKISKSGLNYLKDDGFLVFEIGYNQAESVFKILKDFGYKNIELIKDYSDNDRVLVARK